MRLHAILLLLCMLPAVADTAITAPPCDKSLIKTFAAPMKYDNVKLECEHKYQVFKYTDSAQVDKESHTLNCAATGNWQADKGVDTGIPVDKEITVTQCAENPCDEARITKTSGVVYTPLTPPDVAKLTCPPGKQVEVVGVAGLYDELKCDAAVGWKDATGAVMKQAMDQFAAKCVGPAPSATCTKDAADTEAKVEQDILKCVDSSAKLKVDSKLYDSLKCDGAKWKDNDHDIAPATTKLMVTCVKPCTNIKRLKQGSTKIADGTEVGTSTDIDDSTPGVFKCKGEPQNGPFLSREKNGIMLDEKFVPSHLYCDVDNGWTDFAKRKIFDNLNAFSEVTISCGKSPCYHLGGATCGAFTAGKHPPQGYECTSSAVNSPFQLTDNGNQLNCDTSADKLILYSISSKKFYKLHETPICKDGDKWYKYDDTAQEPITGVRDDLICIRKRCNNCPILPDIDPLGSAQENAFDEGTADQCAKSTCPNHLWKVKKVGGTETEEYAGEVTCSSEEATNKKWLIDGKTDIVEGSCVTSVSCTVAAALTTSCDASWAEMQCKALTLNDDTAVTCAEGKMFYIPPGLMNAEEGATSIQCVKDKGEWKLATTGGDVVLNRGGTVVCADRNPAPTTTTTPAPLPACEICPDPHKDRYSCETCSDKDFYTKNNTDICEARLTIPSMQWHTSSLGTIEGKPLVCKGTDGKWKTQDGKEVGQFAKYEPIPEATEEQKMKMAMIIGGSVAGVIVLIIILCVVYKVMTISRKKKTQEEKEKEEKKKRIAEEGKKRKKSRGNNDEILDEISAQAPSEIQL